MVSFGECNHACSQSLGYGHGVVGTLHVAHQHLVKSLGGTYYLFEHGGGIVGIDDHRNLVFVILHDVLCYFRVIRRHSFCSFSLTEGCQLWAQ